MKPSEIVKLIMIALGSVLVAMLCFWSISPYLPTAKNISSNLPKKGIVNERLPNPSFEEKSKGIEEKPTIGWYSSSGKKAVVQEKDMRHGARPTRHHPGEKKVKHAPVPQSIHTTARRKPIDSQTNNHIKPKTSERSTNLQPDTPVGNSVKPETGTKPPQLEPKGIPSKPEGDLLQK
jgi:hypothetical protein